MKLKIKLFNFIILLSVLAFNQQNATAQDKTGYRKIKSLPIKSAGGWDYLFAVPELNRLYVSHGNQVNIINLKTGDSTGIISNTQGVHGIAVALALNKGYTSNGKTNTVSVFDLRTNKVIATIPCGSNPDAIFYDDFSKKIYTCNGKSEDATVIDVATDKVVATIALGAKPETAVSNGKGKIFVNAETTNEVIVIDAMTYKVVTRYKIKSGQEPTGLDIDRKTNRLFIACGGNKTMVIMDATNGDNLAKFPIGGSDGLVFDPALKLAFASNGEGTISVVRELNADHFKLIQSIPSEKSARTITIDLKSHHLFLSAAKTVANPAGGYPKMVPGTFHVLEIGK